MTLDTALWIFAAGLTPAIGGLVGMWWMLREIKRVTAQTHKTINEIRGVVEEIERVTGESRTVTTKLRDAISEIGDEVHDLHEMHDQRDSDGVYRWWVPARMTLLLERLANELRDLATAFRYQGRDSRGQDNGEG